MNQVTKLLKWWWLPRNPLTNAHFITCHGSPTLFSNGETNHAFLTMDGWKWNSRFIIQWRLLLDDGQHRSDPKESLKNTAPANPPSFYSSTNYAFASLSLPVTSHIWSYQEVDIEQYKIILDCYALCVRLQPFLFTTGHCRRYSTSGKFRNIYI